MLRILIIEDQLDIAASIWDYLERRLYAVDHARDGDSGLARAIQGGFDVVVLDLGLPGMDGLELCRRLRAEGRAVPVLMLTARDTLEDKLRGFCEGADDYMVKPFLMAELEARIQALHRRGRPSAGAEIGFGDISYQPSTMLASREGRQFILSRSQARLLELLLREAPSVVSHQRLMRELWSDGEGDVASLHTHFYALRNMLDKPFSYPMIHSVHGIGYRVVRN